MHLLIHESGSGGGGLLTRPERHGIVGRLAGRRPPGRVHRRHFEAVRGEGPQAVHRERGGVVLGGGAADLLWKTENQIQGSLPRTKIEIDILSQGNEPTRVRLDGKKPLPRPAIRRDALPRARGSRSA